MKLREPENVSRFRVFLSSSSEDEAVVLRDRIEDLVHQVFNSQLAESGFLVELFVVRWEQEAPQKAPGENVNEMFVDEVRRSHLTIVLLFDELRPGTRDELQAALDEPDVQLAVLRFRPEADEPDEIDTFFEPHRKKILYQRCGAADEDGSWFSAIRTLLNLTLSAIEMSRTAA